MKKRNNIIFIILIFLLTITSCKKKEFIEPKATQTIWKEKEKSFEDKAIITYASGFDDRDETIRLINEFNAINNDIFVIYQELPKNKDLVKYKINENFENNATNYDVICIENTWIPLMSRNNNIENISTFVHKDEYDINLFLDSLINSTTFDSTIWGIPKEVYTNMLYFNEELINQPAKTWDELLMNSETQATIGQLPYYYGISVDDDRELFLQMLELIYSNNGRFMDYYGDVSIEIDGIVNGLEKYEELATNKLSPQELRNVNKKLLIIDFQNNNSAYLRAIPSTWSMKGNIINKEDKPFYMTSLPINQGASSNVVEGTSLAINTKSENKEQAWEFIKYLSNTEVNKSFSMKSGKLPVIKSLYEDDDIIKMLRLYDPEIVRDNLDRAKPSIKSEKYDDIFKVLVEEFRSYVNNEKSAQETADRIEERLIQIHD